MASIRSSLLFRRLFAILVLSATAGLVILAASTEWLASFGAPPEGERLARMQRSERFFDGAFKNPAPVDVMKSDTSNWAMFKESVFGDEQRTPPRPLPLHDPRPDWVKPPDSGLRATWLGHSTVLIELGGARVLTDPVWGPRASPSSLVGPLRFHPPAVELEALPKLDAVLISHDHYDHLDMVTVRALAARGVPFYVPLGIGAHLESWGVPAERITELEWWQEAQVPGTDLTLVSTPSQHFSGRALHDRNRTLWTSWVVRSPQHRVYFSGDTGLAPEFPMIGQRLGPFDLVMLEVGAWNPAWGGIHLGAEQALTALGQLGGGPFLPIHWGTFNLAFHAWDDPLETLSRRAPELGIKLLTPRIGEPLEPSLPTRTLPWWREVSQGAPESPGTPSVASPSP